MLFLISGASGVGKSTVREILKQRLGADFEAVELRDLGSLENVSIARRQELAEVAANRAAELAEMGRHLLLSGDPVAPAEIIAAPSSIRTGGVAVALLDADADTQAARLRGRGDPEEYLHLHLGFAQWMREHAADPNPRLDVVSSAGWPQMQWDRLAMLRPADPRWTVTVIDTGDRNADAVADDALAWIRRALTEGKAVMHPEHWS